MKALFPYFVATDDIIVRVSVSFLPEQSEPARGRWFWAYHVRVENEGDAPVQLLTRRWSITDGRGTVHHVEGEGVVGEQPVIHPNASYDYVSGCPLNTSTGVMEGHYTMVAADGRMLRVAIPRFALVAPAEAE
ncbi:MAG: Co2+/Mg2+ efflux protein ApaG [Sphingobium sp.]|nr:Co2+/Mg2+ efflux protein ApaG [Sphingobium sp.]MBP6112317.1 Co2+/Mg2+ efflux protein ApaG [Sphingobium sp.]MBP8670096.1 Co2+/Mg2+ efflux protein ApaG [Sphingobium sp.]MBP9157399.1 Co2+/Mg2+ efflux protein ApaG [Sphingobium sp.]MCC6482304.1 Co2+/Mg2+ efflux protein ApaG [Sphingomonadaceae bacterium]